MSSHDMQKAECRSLRFGWENKLSSVRNHAGGESQVQISQSELRRFARPLLRVIWQMCPAPTGVVQNTVSM